MKTPAKKSTVLTTKGTVEVKAKAAAIEIPEVEESAPEIPEIPEISAQSMTADLGQDPEEQIKFAPPSNKDMVRIVLHEDCTSPTIGKWKGIHELRIPKMLKHEIYSVPRFVADHLVMVKRAVVVK